MTVCVFMIDGIESCWEVEQLFQMSDLFNIMTF